MKSCCPHPLPENRLLFEFHHQKLRNARLFIILFFFFFGGGWVCSHFWLSVRNSVEVLLISADCKRGRRKGATSKNVKNRQKVSKSFSTLFNNFRAGQKTSKIVKKCQKVFRHFSTIFARHLFSGPFCNPLIIEIQEEIHHFAGWEGGG